jgi:hypothetical protein
MKKELAPFVSNDPDKHIPFTEKKPTDTSDQTPNYYPSPRKGTIPMGIRRIRDYDDQRYSTISLQQGGSFLIDETRTSEFEIIDRYSAILRCERKDIEVSIETLRFYAEHITRFYDERMNVLKEYPRSIRFQSISKISNHHSSISIRTRLAPLISIFEI